MLIINTKEIGEIFSSLHAPYSIKVKEGDAIHEIIKFDSNVDGEELEFYFEIKESQLKKQNKCLIQELEHVKMELHRLKGEK